MTNTEAGLLDDIIANPADDVPRLIYADWLEEHDRRLTAQCIRRQIAGEIGVPPLLDFANVVEPLGVSGVGRRVAVPGCCTWTSRCDTVQVVFRRGFVAEIHAPLAVLLGHLPRLVREQPLEAVRAVDAVPFHSDAFNHPQRRFWYNAEYWGGPGRPISYVPASAVLPVEVFNRLPLDLKGHPPYRCTYTEWQDLDAAHAALSVALLRWAKAHPLTRDVHLS